jgi:hypothetical protein
MSVRSVGYANSGPTYIQGHPACRLEELKRNIDSLYNENQTPNRNTSTWCTDLNIHILKKDLQNSLSLVNAELNNLKQDIKTVNIEIYELKKFKEYFLSNISSFENSKEIDSIKSDINSCKKYNEDIHKRIYDLELENGIFKNTNEYLMKNLKEQIEINNKLCERIFEMKEEKFKNEKS